MQYIRDIHAAKKAAGQPVISYEFFPPKTEEGEKNFFEKTLPELFRFKVDYCSVTYGAGGSTRDKTLQIVDRIQREHGVTAMAHLTCVNSTQEQLGGVLAEAKVRGIKNILALRGDPPGGNGEFKKVEGGFEYSYELVRFIRAMGGFCIGTAGFPEGHMACKEGKHVDWHHLKFKVDQGAEFVLSQLFFDNADFFEFRDYVTKRLGMTAPIYPGILPILNTGQIKRFTTMCGARMPQPMLERLEQLGDNDAAVTEYGIEYATRQCEELLRQGAPGVHFYTLNKAHSTMKILRNLGLVNSP